MKTAAAALLSLLLAAPLAAQPAHEVADLVPDDGFNANLSSAPTGFTAVGGKVFFRTSRGRLGTTDGTAAGTQLLPPSPERGACLTSDLLILGAARNLLFYLKCADDDNFAVLRRTDGTAAGSIALTSLRSPFIYMPVQFPGDLPDDPVWAFAGNALYFRGCQAAQENCTLWRSDGTAAGTRAVKPSERTLGPMIGLGSRVLFAAYDGTSPVLAASDGTEAGTVHLKAFSFDSGPRRFAVAGGKAFFLAGTDGQEELWVSDGTVAGTRAVSHFAPPRPFEGTKWLAPIGNRVYFLADDVEHGAELWRSDGTEAGTVRLTDFGFHAPFQEDLRPSQVAETTGGRAVFLATDDLETTKLWATDGASTVALSTVCSGDCSDSPRGFDPRIDLARTAGGRVVFSRYGDGHQLEAWSTDGTPAGTVLLTARATTRPLPLQGAAYFGALGQLWRSDGTPAGTRAFSDLPFRASLTFELTDVGAAGGKVLFPATSALYGNELWAADGRPGGTELLGDLAPASAGGSHPHELTAIGDKLVFLADVQGTTGLWTSGGTAADTVPLGVARPTPGCGSGPWIKDLLAAGSHVFFTGPASPGCGLTLWATDGTAAGSLALNVQGTDRIAFQGQIYFLVRNEPSGTTALWRSDGTAAGTLKVLDLPDSAHGAHGLTIARSELYFSAYDDQGTAQAWRSDGTLAGTRQVTARTPDDDGFDDDFVGFVRTGAFIYFRNASRVTPSLWRTDGTQAGTLELLAGEVESLMAFNGSLYFLRVTGSGLVLSRTDGAPAGPAGTTALHTFPDTGIAPEHPFALLGNLLLFTVDDGEHGAEPWVTDGSVEGTRLLLDVLPGPEGSYADGYKAAGGRVFFRADDNLHGLEMWQSDGTPAGTRLVQDVNPGPDSSGATLYTALGDRLFFAADDGTTGSELWVLPLSPLAGEPCQPAADHLCLSGGRYRVDAEWKTPNGTAGTGHAVPLSADTGYFWFFDPANVETVVKMLDGTALNGHAWVFYGALSNLDYRLTVTDTRTGLSRRYLNPQGQFASAGDTHAFGPLGAHEKSAPLVVPPAEPLLVSERVDAAAATGTCVPAAGRLCLAGGRFAVEAAWKDFSNRTGTGTAVPLTGDTGYFWFFDPANVEAVIKVLDATAVNGRFWVYYGALSNVEYTLTVTDTTTGRVKTYRNPLGRFASAGDTAAF